MPETLLKHRLAKSWLKIIIQVDSRMTDAVAAYLSDLTGTGLEISSAENSRSNTDDTFPTETITAYISSGPKESDKNTAAQKTAALRQFFIRLSQIFPDWPEPELLIETIQEEDWGKKWKSFFTSFKITPTLTIRPSWEDAADRGIEAEDTNIVIEMDPGLAFGTGHHASTQLALLLLDELFQDKTLEPKKILDVGTGSGILAMACGLFGAEEVMALDNDPDAVETARQNILRNRLTDTITVSGQDVSSLKVGFDLIVANITHDILAELAISLTNLLLPGGFLVLSGVLEEAQGHSIREVYEKHSLQCIKSLTRDEWTALILQKN